MLVLSLFPGIGLLDRAFEEEGFCVVRGPDVLWGGNVRRFYPPAGRFDGLIGGPPCQSFSALAHLVRAQGREPKFGNLIPEFERCVVEAQPAWFLMENVPAAPSPAVPGYGVASFLLNNAHLAGEDGMGQEQERRRRFSFGVREGPAPNLMRWIDIAALMLPEADRCGSVCQWSPDTTQEAKGRRPAVSSVSGGHGRSRCGPVLSSQLGCPDSRNPGSQAAAVRRRDGTASVRMARYTLADACRLQGLPEDYMAETPFRRDAALKAVANGVPLPMGRAVARAILEALHIREQLARVTGQRFGPEPPPQQLASSVD